MKIMTQRQRLLFFFSYIGTNYNGIQRILAREAKGPDLSSIQGILEFGLDKILRTDNNTLMISSRTDAGVHAINSTVHFDLKRNRVNPRRLCQELNIYLQKNRTDIRINRILEVPEEFHCRHYATSRSYCYRIALINKDFDNCSNLNSLTGALPITQVYRCEPVSQALNFKSICDACKLFVGKWNFLTFSTLSKGEAIEMKEEDYIKTIFNISFGKTSNIEIEASLELDEERKRNQNIEYYEFRIHGSGFLRRQVRKMVGALLAVGSGAITDRDIKFMLENPRSDNWNIKCQTASPYGLFLTSVNYKHLPILRL